MRRLPGFAATSAFRWTLTIAAGFTAMALLLFAFIYWQTAGYEQDRVDGIVIRGADLIARGPADQAGPGLRAWLAEDVHAARYGGLFGADGASQAGDLTELPPELPMDGAVHQVGVGVTGRDGDDDSPEVVRAVVRRLADDRLLVLGYDLDELEQLEYIMVRALGLGVIPAVLLSIMGGTVLALRAQRRIAAVHEAVDRIMHGHLRQRLPVRGRHDELDKVAIAVNEMLAVIEGLMADVHAVGDNIAHDLRTPLTRLRTRLERSRDGVHTREEFQAATDRAIVSVDQALAIVAAVLRIGQIEHGNRTAAFAPVELADVLQDALELYQPLADDRAIALCITLDLQASVLGDRDLLLEAVGNLLDNAVKHAPPRTEVRLALSSDADAIVLRVADRGPGIPAGERDRVLQRFYRTEPSRTVEGSGLGLSLVAAVAALHGCRLRITDGQPGCTVEVVFPTKATPISAKLALGEVGAT